MENVFYPDFCNLNILFLVSVLVFSAVGMRQHFFLIFLGNFSLIVNIMWSRKMKAINEDGQHFLFYGQVKEDIDPFSRFRLSRKVSTFCRIELTRARRGHLPGLGFV